LHEKAVVLTDAGVEVNGQRYDSLSTAARSLYGKPANGWSFWGVTTDAGKVVPLKQVRKKFEQG
jgi:hypothetical protein